MLSLLGACEHSACLFFRAPSYAAKNNRAHSDSMTLALLTFGVLKQIAQRCVHLTCVFVCSTETCVTGKSCGVNRSRRRKRGVKTQMTLGWPLLNFSEKWPHLGAGRNKVWTQELQGWTADVPVNLFFQAVNEKHFAPNSKRDRVSFSFCCFACLNSAALKFLKLFDKKKQKRSNDEMKGDKCNSGRVEMSACHVLSLFQRKILSVSLLFKQSWWFFLLILYDSYRLKGHLLGRRNVSSCLPLINHVLLDYV